MNLQSRTLASMNNSPSVQILQRCLFVFLLCTTTLAPAEALKEGAATPGASSMDPVPLASDQHQALTRLEELDLLSQGLVGKAAAGATPAQNFRIETRMYRELLRQTMLADRQRPEAEQLPQHLLLEMVRMSALLHAAADCKTGYVIICPPDLMSQLRAQQARVSQALLLARGKQK